MSRRIRTVLSDSGRRQAAAGLSAGIVTRTTSYTITEADMLNSGGILTINVTSAAAAVDISLPSAVTYNGATVIMFKPSGNTNAVAFLATNSQTIEGGTANKRWQNATNEQGCCTIRSDGANWRVVAFKGTWVANNV